jgi:Cu-Zn family superoxide dismutase
LTDAVTLRAGPNSVFDADGSALIIHAGIDDYVTDPTGNAGDRVACGLIVSGN